jgi:signal transduction histidine kinase
VDRVTIILVSDEAEFSRSVTACWQSERNCPSFLRSGSSLEFCGNDFDIAIAGAVEPVAIDSVLRKLRSSGKPIIHISRMNGSAPKFPSVIEIAENSGWQDLLVTICRLIVEREHAHAEAAQLHEANVQLDRQASLGRYILETRHTLNNALTSILGNSELALLDETAITSTLYLQLETIRNMGLRMNEIMKRFSSLQKEMQLVEDQTARKPAEKYSAAGA